MINKNLLAEALVIIGFFIGLDTFFWIKKDNIEFFIIMIFLECSILALLALCVFIDKREDCYMAIPYGALLTVAIWAINLFFITRGKQCK